MQQARSLDCHDFHFDLRASRQLGHLDAGASGRVAGEQLCVEGVHGSEVVQVGQKDSGLDHVLEGHVRSGQDGFQVGKDLGGLGFDGIAGQDAGFRNQTDLTGGVQGVASQDSVRVGAESGGGVG